VALEHGVLAPDVHHCREEIAYDIGATALQKHQCRRHEISYEALAIIGCNRAWVTSGGRAYRFSLIIDNGFLE
jgi:hypothetical protein